MLRAEKLIMLTNTAGVLDKAGVLLSGLNKESVQRAIDDGVYYGRHVAENPCRA